MMGGGHITFEMFKLYNRKKIVTTKKPPYECSSCPPLVSATGVLSLDVNKHNSFRIGFCLWLMIILMLFLLINMMMVIMNIMIQYDGSRCPRGCYLHTHFFLNFHSQLSGIESVAFGTHSSSQIYTAR